MLDAGYRLPDAGFRMGGVTVANVVTGTRN
jgi:hypothetical protein